MTNVEAVEILRHIGGSYGDVSKYHTAVNMAISALEKQEEAVEQFCRENSYAPVVMCNDCKWWSDDLWACNKRGHGQAFSGPNFYCADGERKGGDE